MSEDLIVLEDLFSAVVVCSVFSRSGGGLLFRGLSLSIMGAGAFHGRVRDGIGCRHSALEPPDRLKTEFLELVLVFFADVFDRLSSIARTHIPRRACPRTHRF